MTWSEENRAIVRGLWEAGHSAGEIAFEIGCTRNAAIGIIYRGGYQQPPKKRRPAPPKAPPPTPPVQRVPKNGLTIFQLLDHHCRWPNGERPPFRYCGQTAIDGSSYCATHHRKAHHS
jgi:hypothetical protein